MKGKKGPDFQKTLVSATGLVVLLAILIPINVILSYANIRWDATEDKIYSLSKGTKNILSDLTQTVTWPSMIQLMRSRRTWDCS